MAVKIRLTRIGAKGKPSYRVVAADSESPRDGKFLEILGNYDPRKNPAEVILKEDRPGQRDTDSGRQPAAEELYGDEKDDEEDDQRGNKIPPQG